MQYTCDTDINGIPYAYINIILIEDEIKYTFQKDKTFFEFAVSQQIHVQLNCVEIEFIPTMTPSPATVKFHQVQLSGQQLTVTSVCLFISQVAVEDRLKLLQEAHRDFGPSSQHFLSSEYTSPITTQSQLPLLGN